MKRLIKFTINGGVLFSWSSSLFFNCFFINFLIFGTLGLFQKKVSDNKKNDPCLIARKVLYQFIWIDHIYKYKPNMWLCPEGRTRSLYPILLSGNQYYYLGDFYRKNDTFGLSFIKILCFSTQAFLDNVSFLWRKICGHP